MFAVRPFETKTISWWSSQRPNIDLDPPYQRRSGIWSPREKAYLIDSIINGYDIPKFYIADFTYVNTKLNVNKKQYAVIDGKQRFQALFDFLEDSFPLAGDLVFEKDPTKSISGLRYSELGKMFPEIRAEIDNFNLNIMSVISDDRAKIDSLFVRLNRGKALTGAEIRSAMSGIIPREILKIAENRFFKDCIGFSTQRKQDENVSGKLLLLEINGGFSDTKKKDLDQLVEDFVASESRDVEAQTQQVAVVLNNMTQKLIAAGFKFKSSGLVPVYYWLFRNFPDVQADFVTWFENQRIANSDESIVRFNSIVRSINDKETLDQCYSIMASALARFGALAPPVRSST